MTRGPRYASSRVNGSQVSFPLLVEQAFEVHQRLGQACVQFDQLPTKVGRALE